jgi:hypothetical protein
VLCINHLQFFDEFFSKKRSKNLLKFRVVVVDYQTFTYGSSSSVLAQFELVEIGRQTVRSS